MIEDGAFGFHRDADRAALLRETAIDALQASCARGEVADCTRAASAMGSSFRAGSEPLSSESSMWIKSYAEDGCDGGDPAGCALLGRMYERGLAVPADPMRSTAYYDLACHGGHRRSCLWLAEHASGEDALHAYERACGAGSGYGCAAAGASQRKVARAKVAVEPVVYFARGCAMGDPASCVLGAEMYRSADPPDPRGSVSFAWTGCKHGIPDACLLLADAYARGEGVPKNLAAAHAAYERACDAGLQRGCEAIRTARRKQITRSYEEGEWSSFPVHD
jgi:TPR repeat protein